MESSATDSRTLAFTVFPYLQFRRLSAMLWLILTSVLPWKRILLVSNNTWDLVPRPPGANVVTGKWIFRHKYLADGTLDRYKARWVLHGFTQRPGVDYDETFSLLSRQFSLCDLQGLAYSSDGC